MKAITDRVAPVSAGKGGVWIRFRKGGVWHWGERVTHERRPGEVIAMYRVLCSPCLHATVFEAAAKRPESHNFRDFHCYERREG